jgi:hypothetical protein
MSPRTGQHASDAPSEAATPDRLRAAEQLITEFAARTGVSGPGAAEQRYLWTDAFAVFALLGLYRRTRKREYLDWTLRLVDLVHHALGRFRADDARSGWISGLGEAEGALHPTCGGLRIGKPLPERSPDEIYDDELEWERDGQYFHYLTKWMHALDRISTVTGDPRYNMWAIELAQAARRAFVYRSDAGRGRMYWKMSVDLRRPLVSAMGQLDPLDGFVTFGRLQATRQATSGPRAPELSAAQAEMRRMCRGTSWVTSDPLGIGGLLTEGGQLIQLIAAGNLERDDLAEQLLAGAASSLAMYAAQAPLAAPVEHRLAFRELGLSIGLQAVDAMRAAVDASPERFGGARAAEGLLLHIASLAQYAPLGERLERAWFSPAARAAPAWAAHRDINAVTVATSFVPAVYLLGDAYDCVDDSASPRPNPLRRQEASE